MDDPSAQRAPAPDKHVVGRVSDVPEGGHILVTVANREIGIYRVEGEFYALLNRCPHLGGPLCAGQIVTDIISPMPGDVRSRPGRTFVTCPWHNWEFDVRTGQSYWNARLRALPFKVAVEPAPADAEGRVAGPYTAETVPIAVEDQQLVVSLRPMKPSAAETPA